MRALPHLAIAPLMLAATPAVAALPAPTADCSAFTTIQAVEGRVWEIRGFVCLMHGSPLKVEVTGRREVEPSRALKQGLIW